MAKRLNVALDFTANTTQAKAQIQELQSLLLKIAYGTELKVDATSVQSAANAAKELAVHLNAAFNKETGNYDLSKLQQSLAKSKASLADLSTELLKAGTTGEQAFVKLAQSIASADQPMVVLNGRLQDFLTTLKNTVKWQISSSMIHGVMGALQGAYGYAEDLNKSLNDIRIVTGYNIDYMEKFADKANKAAKALSSTTLDYTDASLIYFQQGLPDEEVEERTNVTIKLANVTGDTAQEVSDQMTAIWNNFAKGSDNLEYYADVMTELGAATAASTSEIAEGLEKFASVADTVGLSYEYAATAVATVVDKTRQSADVVGTAFKTLFARIQDLELGETLDDGTTLGSYSEALQAVGISIKDSNGELKEMDTILNEMAGVWDGLHEDQKVALAESVAGVRQYTQLIALLDNWDSFETNLGYALDSKGTLEEQQKIYEESWEAANNRLKASFQSLYQDIIDDKFFIKLIDFETSLVDGVDDFIDRIGGIEPVIVGLSSLLLGLLSNKIQPALDNAVNNIKILVKGPAGVTEGIYSDLEKITETSGVSGDAKTQLQAINQVTAAKQKLALISDKMTQAEQDAAKVQINLLEKQQLEIEEVIAKKKKLQATVDEVKSQKSYDANDLNQNASSIIKRDRAYDNFNKSILEVGYNKASKKSEKKAAVDISNLNQLKQDVESVFDSVDQASADAVTHIKDVWIEQITSASEQTKNKFTFEELFGNKETFISQINEISEQIEGLNVMGENNNPYTELQQTEKIKTELKAIEAALEPIINENEELRKSFKSAFDAKSVKELQEIIKKLPEQFLNVEVSAENIPKILKAFGFPPKVIKEMTEFKGTTEEAKKKVEELTKASKDLNFSHKISGIETFTSLTSAVGTTVTAINALKSAWETLKDPEVTGWEKISSILSSLTFFIPSAINSITKFKEVFTGLSVAYSAASLKVTNVKRLDLIQTQLNRAGEDSHKKAMVESAAIRVLVKNGIEEETAVKVINTLMTEGLTAAVELLNAELKKEIALVTILNALKNPITWIIGAGTAALIAAVAYAIKRAKDETQSWEEELEQSNKDLESLKTNLSKATSELDELNSKLDSLDSRYSTLNNLTYGSVEWREELYGINSELQGIIDKYGLIEGEDFYRDSQGVLRLTETGSDKVKNDQLSKQLAAQTYTDSQEYRDSNLQITDKKKSLIILDSQEKRDNNRVHAEDDYSNFDDAPDYLKNINTETVFDADPNSEQWIQKKGLSEEEINKVISAALENPEFNFEDINDYINLAGLDKETAELIQSTNGVIDSLKDLTTETQKLSEAYQSDILNDLLERGLDLSGYDEEYRTGVGKALAADVEQRENELTQQIENNGGLSLEQINSVLENYGIEKFETQNQYDSALNGEVLKVSVVDEDGKIANEEYDYGTLIRNYAAEQAREWGLTQQDNYYDEQKYSEQALTTAEGLKSSWDEQSFDEDLIRRQGENLSKDSGALPSEIEKLQSFLSENTESFSKMFGLSEEDFGDWIKDSSNLVDNFGELQEAINSNVGAINELRDEMGSLGTHGQELVDDLADAFKGLSKTTKDALSKAYDTNDLSGLTEEALGEVDQFIEANSSSLSDLAGVSESTFKQMYKNANSDFGKKVAKLLPEITKGSKKALSELAITTQKEYYTTGDNIIKAVSNVESNWDNMFSQMSRFANKSASDAESVLTNCFDVIQRSADALQINPEFNTEPAISALNTLIAAFGFTEEQAKEFVASMGFSAEFESEPKTVHNSETAVVYTDNLDEHGHHLDPPKVIPIEYDETIQVPTITTLDYEGNKYGGDLIDKSSGDNTTNTNPTEGGGGGDNYTAPPPKEYDDEIERYHVIKQKIEDLEEVMDHLAKAKDRAFGTSKLKIMDEEIEKYNEMIDLQNQYISEIEANLAKDKALIASYGAVFDETGVITNYEEIMKRQIDIYNSAIGKNSDADDAAEEAYDDFLEALDQYEETNNLLQDELETLYDLKTELADVIFEKTEYKITIQIDVKDEELEYLEYLLSKIEDDAYAAAEAIALIGAQSQNALDKINAYEEGLLELLSNHGINSIEELNSLSTEDLLGKEFTEDEIDLIREWNSAILEANQSLLEMRDTIQESILENFEQFNDDLDRQIELFEHYDSVLETVKDITNLLGNELDGASRKVVHDLNRASLNNSINNVAGSREILASLKERREVVEAQYQAAVNAGNSEAIQSWADTLDEIDDQINDAEEDFLDTWLESLEKAKEIFEEEMDEIAADFEKGISPIYSAIDTLRDVIGRADEVENQYLSDSDKVYELSKLRRQIEGSIDDTDLVANKQALSKLQDEINKKLKDGTKISEYDLKILQSKYDLELARQALDEAQNSNNMVRLTRDNNGNYGYVYTADEDKIAEAEQDYEDKLHAYQEANEDYLAQLQDDILSVQETFIQEMKEINLAYANGEIDQAEQEARISEINSWYADRMEFLRQQYDVMFENSQVAAEIFKEYYQDTTSEILTTFDQTSLSIATGYDSLESMFKSFWSTHNEYVGNANDLMDKYLTKLEDINKVAGTMTGAFSDSASGWAITITGESEEVLNDLGTISQEAAKSFQEVIDAAAEWESSYGAMLDSAIAKSEALVREMQEMIAALSGLESTDFSQYESGIQENSTATANNIVSVRKNSGVNAYSTDSNTTSLPAVVSGITEYVNADLNLNSGLSNILNNLDLDNIVQSINLNVVSLLSQLTGLRADIISQPVEHIFNQNVQIDADFPNVSDSNEIVDALQTIVEEASQFANQKSV